MNEEEKKNLLAAIDLIITDLEKLLAKANKSIPKKRPTPEELRELYECGAITLKKYEKQLAALELPTGDPVKEEYKRLLNDEFNQWKDRKKYYETGKIF